MIAGKDAGILVTYEDGKGVEGTERFLLEFCDEAGINMFSNTVWMAAPLPIDDAMRKSTRADPPKDAKANENGICETLYSYKKEKEVN